MCMVWMWWLKAKNDHMKKIHHNHKGICTDGPALLKTYLKVVITSTAHKGTQIWKKINRLINSFEKHCNSNMKVSNIRVQIMVKKKTLFYYCMASCIGKKSLLVSWWTPFNLLVMSSFPLASSHHRWIHDKRK